MNIRYTNRMKEIVNMVENSKVTADIGADHSLVAINIIMSGRAEKVYASDINEGPVLSAKKNIEKFGVEDRVIPIVADGLDGVYDKADTVIIAGMGGELIASILNSNDISGIKTFILQPMSHAEILREELLKLGLLIKEEKLVEDYGRIYCIIKAEHGKADYSPAEICIGPYIIKNQDRLFNQYIKRLSGYYEKKALGKDSVYKIYAEVTKKLKEK